MFDIGGGELLVIGVVALLVVKPKDLPGMFRTVGNAMGKVRRMAGEFRWQFDEAMREAEIDQAKKAFTDVNDLAQSAKPSFNPLDTIRSEIQSVKDEIRAGKPTAAPDVPIPADVLPDPMPLTPPAPIASTVAEIPVAESAPEPKPKRVRAKKTTEAGGEA
ncbi:MAG: Sec-independent protein translocase protein TatB [Beijerinckiaceae bacterium]